MSGTQIVGAYLVAFGSSGGLLYLIVKWGNRKERAKQTEPRLPRLTVRVNDLLDTNTLADELRMVGRYTP